MTIFKFEDLFLCCLTAKPLCNKVVLTHVRAHTVLQSITTSDFDFFSFFFFFFLLIRSTLRALQFLRGHELCRRCNAKKEKQHPKSSSYPTGNTQQWLETVPLLASCGHGLPKQSLLQEIKVLFGLKLPVTRLLQYFD